MRDKVFVVIPVYNEERHIGGVLRKVLAKKYEAVVVDDGSTDKTREICLKSGAIILSHRINLGKGAAAKTGCDYAISKGANIIVLMDGDGQHKPEDLPRILSELRKTGSDIVFGFRRIDRNMPEIMKLGNTIINATTKLVQGIDLNDTQSGFRAFRAEAYRSIRWNSNDYSMESEMVSRVSRNRLKYSQIEIQTIYKDKFKGTTIFDGIKIFLNIFKFRFLGG